MPNGFRGEIHFFALFCEKLIKKPCLLIVQNQFHGMFARFDADIAVISAVDQGYLEESVIQAYILSRQVFEAADGLGIRHHTVDILSLKGFTVCLDFNPVRRHIPDPFGSLQQVCQMAEMCWSVS